MAKKAKARGDRLLVSLVLPFLAGAVGSVFTFREIIGWYATLPKPAWNPPNAVFGPVWTVLYVMIGISMYLFWQAAAKKNQKVGFELIGLQLVLNALWSIVFFGLHQPQAAVVVIIALWCAIIANIVTLGKSSRAAGYWLVPYLLWVSFAGVLNYAVAVLN